MMISNGFLDLSEGDVIEIGMAVDHHRTAHVIDRRSVVAVNAALATGRPLLVRGEPGVGKSQLARASAVRLRRRFLRHAVDATTEPLDLLYTVDAVARLAEAHIVGALREGSRNDVAVEKFVRPGALWWAYDWKSAEAQMQRAGFSLEAASIEQFGDQGMVLLIDEIDKADSAVPNALLDALGHRKFDVPGSNPVQMSAERPLVVITTNEERSLPDAFLRRCFVLHLGLPDHEGDAAVRKALQARGAAHFPNCDPALLAQAAAVIATRRLVTRRERLPAPGVAEYIDLLDAVIAQCGNGTYASALLDEIATFVLDKHAPPSSAMSEHDA
jgi:MoxR-like ATPase